jgi:hypothetical protein
MDYNYKSIAEKRREALFEQKMKKMAKTQNLKSVIAKKFSGFSKADRFAYRIVSKLLCFYFLQQVEKQQPDNVGPGSYNSNPFLNIEASVNASHHIVSIV